MRDTSGFGPSHYSAVQADRGRFWRDRGFWVQFVIQTGVFFIFGALDLGTAASLNSEYGTGGWTITQILVISGYVVAFVGLLVQRKRPETGLIIVAVGLLSVGAGLSEVYSLAAGIVCYEAWFISGFLRRRRRAWLVVLVVGAVVGILVASYSPTVVPGWGVASAEIEGQSAASVSKQTAIVAAVLIVLTLISVALCWQLGLGVRRQHERMENLAARAELAAVAERNRIAREMHDIVAHSLTAVIAQAGGGRYAGRKEPEKAIEALDTISATGREALAQMRQLLSVLRADEPRDANSAPGVGGVPSLVEDATRSGLQADLSILGEPRPVSPTVGLTVYRTVQEALTNVLKHAGRVTTHVVLDWRTPGELHIQLDNAPGQGLVDASSAAGGAGGQGLIGLKERARVHGGSATWGPSETFPDGWQVVVMLKA